MGAVDVFETELGRAVAADCSDILSRMDTESVDLVITSPPFDLQLAKEYGNLRGSDYLDWLEAISKEVLRVLKSTGSFVLDLGGAWNRGSPTRNLYQFRLLLRLVDDVGFHLAQDFYWWNPSRLPTPAEWVTIRRIRVKDAINTVWWLSKTEFPKSSNRRVLQEYSDSQRGLFRNGYKAQLRPSGHNISTTFGRDNGGAIPPNLLAAANTESTSSYSRYCKQIGLTPHPARFPVSIPEFFIRMLTDRGDLVVDPFAGSCTTGEAAEKLARRWLCVDVEQRYLEGGRGRFVEPAKTPTSGSSGASTYSVARVDQYSARAEEDIEMSIDLLRARNSVRETE